MRSRRPLCVASLLVWFSASAAAQSTLRANVGPTGWPAWYPSLQVDVSADGSKVLVHSQADLTPSTPSPWSQVYLCERATGAVSRISVANDGSPANSHSAYPALSADGRFAAFGSEGSNLVAGDANGWDDVFVRDRVFGTTVCASVTASGSVANSFSRPFGLSDDGQRVAFESLASDLVLNDANGLQDVYLRDLATQTTFLASVATSGAAGNAACTGGGLSGDGRFVVFDSAASDLVLGDTNGVGDVFIRDLTLGTTERASVSSLGGESNGISRCAQISSDGRYVFFVSFATQLVFGDTNGYIDAFLFDRTTGATERVSVGAGGVEADSVTIDGGVSGDGRYVTFVSMATNLVAPALGGFERDVFVRDRVLGVNWHASRGPAGVRADGPCFRPRVSDDGATVVYPSDATNLVVGDINGERDAFLTSQQSVGSVASYGTAKTSSAGCASFVTTAGFPRASGDDAFFVVASGVLAQKSGTFFWGRASANLPFGGGTLFVQPPLVRTPVQSSGSSTVGAACSGHLAFHFAQAYMVAKLVLPGDTLYGQFWFRDPGFAPPNNLGLSNAVQFSVGP